MLSHFFAYLSRMKFIRRWGLMHSTYPENIQEHSSQVAMVAHALAIIRNRVFAGRVNPDRVAALALYHDAGEVLIGDLPTPVKYFNPDIKTAYQAIEQTANAKLLSLIPAELRADYRAFFQPQAADAASLELVKAADKLCAYLKCVQEVSVGNTEFSQAEKTLRATLEDMRLPEVGYFLDTFAPSFRLTLDELN